MRSVVVGSAVYGHPPLKCILSAIDLLLRAKERNLLKSWCPSGSPYIDWNRNDIVRTALAKEDVTHVLMLDQDMLVPVDALERLLAHGKPVVGGLYFLKSFPHNPVAWLGEPPPHGYLTEYHSGLNRADGIGMGCTLIEASVFRKMEERWQDQWWYRVNAEEARPIDSIGLGPKELAFYEDKLKASGIRIEEAVGVRASGEDVWFGKRCAELDIPIYLDADLKCGHVGDAATTESHFLAAKRILQNPDAVKKINAMVMDRE